MDARLPLANFASPDEIMTSINRKDTPQVELSANDHPWILIQRPMNRYALCFKRLTVSKKKKKEKEKAGEKSEKSEKSDKAERMKKRMFKKRLNLLMFILSEEEVFFLFFLSFSFFSYLFSFIPLCSFSFLFSSPRTPFCSS